MTTRQEGGKKRDRKGESNESSEIQGRDGKGALDIPGLPSGHVTDDLERMHTRIIGNSLINLSPPAH